MFAPSSFCQLCRFQDIISINTNKSLLRRNRSKLFPKSFEFILKDYYSAWVAGEAV